jgi:hypothetical protein
LQGIARNCTILASWNRPFTGKRRTFAVSGHPEYRFYDKIDAQMIEFPKESVYIMKYKELIPFEALETMIQLRDANKSDSREQFVSSYAISDEMANRISRVFFPSYSSKTPRTIRVCL